MTTAFCSACAAYKPVDAKWRALWIDSDGDLLMTPLERAGDLDFERPGTVFACGEGHALMLVERYLHSESFYHAHDAEISLMEAARLPATDLYPELT